MPNSYGPLSMSSQRMRAWPSKSVSSRSSGPAGGENGLNDRPSNLARRSPPAGRCYGGQGISSRHLPSESLSIFARKAYLPSQRRRPRTYAGLSKSRSMKIFERSGKRRVHSGDGTRHAVQCPTGNSAGQRRIERVCLDGSTKPAVANAPTHSGLYALPFCTSPTTRRPDCEPHCDARCEGSIPHRAISCIAQQADYSAMQSLRWLHRGLPSSISGVCSDPNRASEPSLWSSGARWCHERARPTAGGPQWPPPDPRDGGNDAVATPDVPRGRIPTN